MPRFDALALRPTLIPEGVHLKVPCRMGTAVDLSDYKHFLLGLKAVMFTQLHLLLQCETTLHPVKESLEGEIKMAE